MRENVRSTRRAIAASDETKEALKIARRNATAASSLAKISDRATRIQLRPYLNAAGIEIEDSYWDSDDRFSSIHLTIVNNGQTPALVTRFFVSVHSNMGKMFTKLLEVEKPTKFRVYKGKQPTNIPLTIRADGDGLDEAGQLVAFVVLDYTDAFKKEYSDAFCFQLGDEKGSFDSLDLPAHLNHFPLPDYLDLFGLAEDLNPKEDAAGVRVQPLTGIPVWVTAERRQALGRYGGGRNAFALFLESGLYEQPLPWRFSLDSYLQAGVVGERSRDWFVDGGLWATRPVYRNFSAGLGVWGAGQPGLYRVEAGPRLTMRVRGNIKAHLDWRQRLVGNARPGSGAALNLAADF